MHSQIHPKDETYTPKKFNLIWFNFIRFDFRQDAAVQHIQCTFSLIRLLRAHKEYAIAELCTQNKRGEEQKRW